MVFNDKKRFAKVNKVYIIYGDSSKKIKQIVDKISSPVFFWLDAHYSGGITAKGKNPILKELLDIFNNWSSKGVVLIDDARLFGKGDYPPLDSIIDLVNS